MRPCKKRNADFCAEPRRREGNRRYTQIYAEQTNSRAKARKTQGKRGRRGPQIHVDSGRKPSRKCRFLARSRGDAEEAKGIRDWGLGIRSRGCATGSASGCCDAFPLPPSALRLISRLPPSEFRICFPPSALFFAFPFLGSACFFLAGDYLGVRPGPSLSTGAIANGHLIALTSASETARAGTNPLHRSEKCHSMSKSP